jgi:hypothetical protein
LRSFASPNLWKGIAGAGVGFLGARFIPQNVPFLKQYNTGFAGYGLNIASGAAVAWLVGKWDRGAGYGALIGTGLAVIARFMSDTSMGASAALQLGDADADLGYYMSDRFPFAQGAGGPYDTFPGSAYLAAGPFPTTTASAVRAGASAAAAALPAAAASAAPTTAAAGDRWNSRW